MYKVTLYNMFIRKVVELFRRQQEISLEHCTLLSLAWPRRAVIASTL